MESKILNDFLLMFIFPIELRKSMKEHNKSYFMNKHFMSYYNFENGKIQERRQKKKDKLIADIISKTPSPPKELHGIEIYSEPNLQKQKKPEVEKNDKRTFKKK